MWAWLTVRLNTIALLMKSFCDGQTCILMNSSEAGYVNPAHLNITKVLVRSISKVYHVELLLLGVSSLDTSKDDLLCLHGLHLTLFLEKGSYVIHRTLPNPGWWLD